MSEDDLACKEQDRDFLQEMFRAWAEEYHTGSERIAFDDWYSRHCAGDPELHPAVLLAICHVSGWDPNEAQALLNTRRGRKDVEAAVLRFTKDAIQEALREWHLVHDDGECHGRA